MKSYTVLQLLGLIHTGRAAQPSAAEPVPAPIRDLQFGDINFLHTTDTHGWHAGHLLEPSFSADWGDYIDFSQQLRRKIEADGNDLLVIDTGDRVEGNGLYDASEPKGLFTFGIVTQQHMDILCSGNHELYKQNSSENDYNILVPAYRPAYVASNLDIYDPTHDRFVAFAPRFRKFTTKNRGLHILALGFVFNFDRNANNTKVTLVEQTVQEPWFQEVIRDSSIDLVIVAAHAAARSEELDTIHKEIRKVKKDIPIQFLAGHFHVRDYKKFDDTAHVLASGRFLETIGFASISGIEGHSSSEGRQDRSSIEPKSKSKPTWFRSYIDNNLYSFYHHTNTTANTFHSKHGRSVSKQITKARKALKLDENYGCAPMDLWMSRAPFPAHDSIFTWLNESVFPSAVVEESRKYKPRIILCNTGAIRFDIFKGPYTRDSTLIVSPFTSGMHYIPDVPLAQASKVVTLLNDYDQTMTQRSDHDAESNPEYNLFRETWRLAPPQQWHSSFNASTPPLDHLAAAAAAAANHQQPLQIPLNDPNADTKPIPKLTPGYITTDDLGTTGDDTIHSPIPNHRVPNVIQSHIPFPSSNKIDLIFNEYLQPYVLMALKFQGLAYDEADVQSYLHGETMTDMITRWVKENWTLDC